VVNVYSPNIAIFSFEKTRLQILAWWNNILPQGKHDIFLLKENRFGEREREKVILLSQ